MTYIASPTTANDTSTLVRFINDELLKIARETIGQAQGHWTPQLAVSSGSVTVSAASGDYAQIGNLVHISGSIQLSASSGSGSIQIRGLPLAQGSGKGIIAFRHQGVSNISTGVIGYVDGRTIRVQSMTATGASNPTLTSTSLLEFSGTYLA
nr:hypothetical protein [uncultured Mediterranean phage uvMED]